MTYKVSKKARVAVTGGCAVQLWQVGNRAELVVRRSFVSLALALLLVAVFLGPGDVPERLIGLAVFFLPVCGLSLGGLLMLHSWLDKRSPGQLPRGPAPGMGGQVSHRPVSADPGGQLPPADPGHRDTAEAARRRRPRPPLPVRGHGAGAALPAGTALASG